MRRKIYTDLPRWIFELDQLTDTVYSVMARYNNVAVFSREGSNINQLFDECHTLAHHPDAMMPDALRN